MRILFLSTWFPFPTDNGSKIRNYNLLKGLASRHQTHLLCLTDQMVAEPFPEELNALCVGIETVSRRAYRPSGPRALLGLVQPTPRWYVDTYSRDMERVLKLRLSEPFDLVMFSEAGLLAYSHMLQGHCAILEGVEVGGIYQREQVARWSPHSFRNALMQRKMSRFLKGRIVDFAACTVVSEPERRLLASVVGDNTEIHVIPNCVDLHRYGAITAQPDSQRLVFAGSLAYPVNYSAMEFFMREIYPMVQKQASGVSIHITGACGNAPWPPCPIDESVQFAGFVPDIAEFIAQSAVSVAPIRSGGGTRLKILEAMAIGTPVVATAKGAEGLDVKHGEHLLIADEPREFAGCVIRLLQDADLRLMLAVNARKLVAERYDWAVVMPRFLDWIEGVAANGRKTVEG